MTNAYHDNETLTVADSSPRAKDHINSSQDQINQACLSAKLQKSFVSSHIQFYPAELDTLKINDLREEDIMCVRHA